MTGQEESEEQEKKKEPREVDRNPEPDSIFP